ncbi:MAG: mitochondrial fission ELM1 family protein [Rhodospirillaceae bacterium]|nr:mitochondrial fission ELM1 family protein [Rhodospirillaceae bacterium]
MHGQPLIWVLTDDRAGNVAQALGVAEALGRDFKTVPIRYNPLARLPNALTGASLIGLAPETRMTFGPPWPDVVIAAGRRTGPIARWIKKNAGKAVILAQIMNPGRRGAEDFDLIVVPRHDCERPAGDAPNVMRVTGAPHRLTKERLASAADAWRGRIKAVPKPLIALIVGGATRRKPFPADLARTLAAEVSRVAEREGGTVLLASSRRTGAAAEQAMKAAVSGPHQLRPHHAFFWSAGGDNPYFGYLALADAIVVTGDSVSMCSEACATSAPVYIYAPDGMVAPKHARLHRHLYGGGFARPFRSILGGEFERWTHPPLNAAGEVAQKIDDLIRRRFG